MSGLLRIFVSSTFDDMHIERDCLEDIEQDLNVGLLEFGEKIEFVDLRWGICTEALEEEEKNRAVLEGCFTAIDKSDYLLIFLGNRYGTQKSRNEVMEYLGKEKTDVIFGDEAGGKSITELEVSYANLIRGFNHKNTVICVRGGDEAEENARRFMEHFTTNKEFCHSVIDYSYDQKEALKKELKKRLLALIEEMIRSSSRFDRDKKRLESISTDAILNSGLKAYPFTEEMLIFTGKQGSGKAVTAAELIKRNCQDNTCCFVTWETKERYLTYRQVLKSLAEAFAEIEHESFDESEIPAYLKSCIRRNRENGRRFLLFLDGEDKISNVNYPELIDLFRGEKIIISTGEGEQRRILSAIPRYRNYRVFSEEDLWFESGEIAGVIQREFSEHGKTIGAEALETLTGKEEIVKPLYLHFAVKRLLFLKKSDFDRYGDRKSPEGLVLSIVRELPERAEDLVKYSMENRIRHSDIKEEMESAVRLLAYSYGGINEDVLADYLRFRNKAYKSKKDVMPYLYEIKNRLDDFWEKQGEWIQRKFDAPIYREVVGCEDVKRFVLRNRSRYNERFYIREYLYWNQSDAEELYSFLSAPALWKPKNAEIRKIYREYFWDLVSNRQIRGMDIDDRFFMPILELYLDLEYEFDSRLITAANPVIRLLTENITDETAYLSDRGDGIILLYRLAQIYLEEMRYIDESGWMLCISDIPGEVIEVFNRAAYLFKVISGFLLHGGPSEWNLKLIYQELCESIRSYFSVIENLECYEMLVCSEEEESISYGYARSRLVAAVNFLFYLNPYQEALQSGEAGCPQEICFNWKLQDDKLFDTAKYWILNRLTRWISGVDLTRSRTAMDIISIDYYVNYSRRETRMNPFADAMLLLLILYYEIDQLDHFRSYPEEVESYWIENFPYVVEESVFDPEELKGLEFELRDTVLSTIKALSGALKAVQDSIDIGLKEKCIVEILKHNYLFFMGEIDGKDRRYLELWGQIRDNGIEFHPDWIKVFLDNREIAEELPMDYMEKIGNYNETIRQAIIDLHFTCL